MSSRHILVVTPDSLGARMAGPAIRAFEIAKALVGVGDVRLVSTGTSTLRVEGMEIGQAGDAELREHEKWADVIVFQGHLLASFPWMKLSEKILVVDIYDPMHLEQLEEGKGVEDEDRFRQSVKVIEVLNEQIARADFMLCASEKQRDFWLGQLAGVGRVNPDNYDADASLRSLLDVAPFGLSETPPTQSEHAIKGTVPGIGVDDKVIIWGGGIYNWFDPMTLIRAVHALSLSRPNVRLFFLGAKHPNPNVPTMRVALEARELAEELGLIGSVVFFNEGWVPYDSRADYLLDADVGVSTHFEHVETAYSFRTRILDYLWASLPIVSTAGDTFADLIEQHGLGRVVPAEDVEALEAALAELLFDDVAHSDASAHVRAFASSMTWSKALEPLIRFCADPRRAPDRAKNRVIASNVQLEMIERRVHGLEASTSWRITAPLRAVTAFVRRRSAAR